MKKWWESLTLWFNGLLVASIGLFEVVLPHLADLVEFFLPQFDLLLPTLQPHIPPEMYGRIFIVSSIINILLRFKTRHAVTIRRN